LLTAPNLPNPPKNPPLKNLWGGVLTANQTDNTATQNAESLTSEDPSDSLISLQNATTPEFPADTWAATVNEKTEPFEGYSVNDKIITIDVDPA
jgi:hypothetical protein